MGNRFASGKNSIAMCDRCGFQFKLTALRKEIQKTKIYNLLVCPECWDPDQPQLLLGMYPVDDPMIDSAASVVISVCGVLIVVNPSLPTVKVGAPSAEFI